MAQSSAELLSCKSSEDLHEGGHVTRVVGAVPRQPGEEMNVLAACLLAIVRSVGVWPAVDDADGLLEFLDMGDGATGGYGHFDPHGALLGGPSIPEFEETREGIHGAAHLHVGGLPELVSDPLDDGQTDRALLREARSALQRFLWVAVPEGLGLLVPHGPGAEVGGLGREWPIAVGVGDRVDATAADFVVIGEPVDPVRGPRARALEVVDPEGLVLHRREFAPGAEDLDLGVLPLELLGPPHVLRVMVGGDTEDDPLKVMLGRCDGGQAPLEPCTSTPHHAHECGLDSRAHDITRS